MIGHMAWRGTSFLSDFVCWEWRSGKEYGNYYHGLYRDYYKDPSLDS